MRKCGVSGCEQMAESEVLRRTKRVEVERTKGGELISMRGVADYCQGEFCYFHKKKTDGLIN